mmetsp:Transcript_5966/g.15587  ORF Transcript_5966/g.15587 Transcript_5966/m.15587 type:complete len:207 (-) Transcript_5966:3-623(-)
MSSSSSSSATASSVAICFVGAFCAPPIVSTLSSSSTFCTSSSAASSASSSSSTSMASSTISSITPALVISFCISCIVCMTSPTFTSLFMCDMTCALFCMCPVIFTCASWLSICIMTEFIVAFDACIRFVAFRERTSSFARVFALLTSPRFTAALTDALTFISSRWIPRICRSTTRCSCRSCCFHFFTCSLGSGALPNSASCMGLGL